MSELGLQGLYAIYSTDNLFTLAGDAGSNHVNPDGPNQYLSSQNCLVKTASDAVISLEC